MNQRKIAIIGAQGYVGRELARLLLQHPFAHLLRVFSRNPDWKLEDDLPESTASDVLSESFEQFEGMADQFDTVFLATPPEVSMKLVPQLLEHDLQVIDLSGAFRIKQAEQYEEWYGHRHIATEVLKRAQYGLSPWCSQPLQKSNNIQETTKDISFIANPGCYASCILMALLPLLKSQLITENNIVIDAKSGASGAGRQAQETLLFCELEQDFYPYKVGRHQHTPEVVSYLKAFSDCDVTPTILTHLLPIQRGISISIYANVSESFAQLSHSEKKCKIKAAYDDAYIDYPLVRHQYLDTSSAKKEKQQLSLKSVIGSARTQITYACMNHKMIVVACIDNLMKGAASQAIENFNILNGLPVETGVLHQVGTL